MNLRKLLLFFLKLRSTSTPYSWKLLTRYPLDFETAQLHQVTMQVKDVNNSFAVNQSFTIHVTNVNEAPAFIALSNRMITENSPHGTVVGIINVTDPDEVYVPQRITCGLRNDAGGRFKVSGLALTVLDSRMVRIIWSTLNVKIRTVMQLSNSLL